MPRGAGNLCPGFTERPFPTCIHPLPSTGPWCRDLGGCPGPPALGQSQPCCMTLPGLEGCPMAQESCLVLLLARLALLAGSSPTATMGAGAQEAPMPALATPTCGAWPACRWGGGPPLPWPCWECPLPILPDIPRASSCTGRIPWPLLPVSYFQLLPVQRSFRAQRRK